MGEKVPETKKRLKCRGISGDTEGWLEQMGERDTELWGCGKRVWIVDNKMYDLEGFARKHPGGAHWIQMTQGQDISTQFKIHHLQEANARAILKDYLIGDCPRTHPPRFQFEQTGFYDELRSRILQAYAPHQLTDSTATRKRCCLLIAAWIVVLTLAAALKSYCLGALAGCWMVNFYGIGHLFIHRRPNWLKHVYVLLGMSAREQVVMHCLSHHPFPNTELDYEFAAFEPIVNFSRSSPKNSPLAYLGMEIIFATVSFANIVTKLIVVPIKTRTLPSGVQALSLLQILYIYIFSNDLLFSLKLYLLMLACFGIVFGKTIICPHRMGFLWSEGAPEIRDFVLHTVATTSDLSHEATGLESLVRYVGFNIHVAHHLFPTIDHNMLPQCNRIVNQFCQEKGIKIAINGQSACDLKLMKLVGQRETFELSTFYAPRK